MEVLHSLISFIFFLSFYNKSKNVYDLKYEIVSYKLIPIRYAQVAAYALLSVELIISALYLLDFLNLLKAIFAGALIITFSFATIYKKKVDGVKNCNCFGELTWLNKYPIFRNLMILLLIILVAVLQLNYNIHITNNILGLICVFLIVAWSIDIILLTIRIKRLRGVN